jgi:hypothetical protein
MKARYPGSCSGCHGAISVGAAIDYGGRGRMYHAGCAPSQDPAGDREYWQGRRDVDTYHENRALFGEETAEAMEIERDLREGWDY